MSNNATLTPLLAPLTVQYSQIPDGVHILWFDIHHLVIQTEMLLESVMSKAGLTEGVWGLVHCGYLGLLTL